MVGIIPILAAAVIQEDDLRTALTVGKQFAEFMDVTAWPTGRNSPRPAWCAESRASSACCSAWLASTGSRSCSRSCSTPTSSCPAWPAGPVGHHRDHPYVLDVEGIQASIDYEPAESTTAMFGGNSNWRGPLWFPLNYLVISALERYHRFFGDEFTIEYPTGSGVRLTLDKGRRRPAGPAHLDLHPRSRGPPGLLRRDPNECSTIRPGMTT